VRLRNLLKKKLSQTLKGNFWVSYTCGMAANPDSKTIPEKLTELKGTSAHDGVHFTAVGYCNFAKNLAELVLKAQESPRGHRLQAVSAAVPVSGLATVHFWRSFSSPNGARKHNLGPVWVKEFKYRQHNQSGPYQSWKGRAGR
jgi:hypothetical protein